MTAKKVEQTWGHEVHWAKTKKYLGKIIHINRGQTTPRGFHERKEKTIFVLQGILILEIGSDESKNNKPEIFKVLETGETYHIKPGKIHQFTAPREGFVRLLETSTPEEEDLVML